MRWKHFTESQNLLRNVIRGQTYNIFISILFLPYLFSHTTENDQMIQINGIVWKASSLTVKQSKSIKTSRRKIYWGEKKTRNVEFPNTTMLRYNTHTSLLIRFSMKNHLTVLPHSPYFPALATADFFYFQN